jgi:hypothetical protein
MCHFGMALSSAMNRCCLISFQRKSDVKVGEAFSFSAFSMCLGRKSFFLSSEREQTVSGGRMKDFHEASTNLE